jgi:cell division protein FtsB
MIAKKTKIKNSSRPDLSFIFLAVIFFSSLIFLIVSNVRISQKRALMTNEINSLQEQIQRLQESKTNLETNINKADQDSYWEEKAREQGFVKEGENQVVVLPVADSSGNSDQNKNNSGFFKGLLQSISNFFSGLIRR